MPTPKPMRPLILTALLCVACPSSPRAQVLINEVGTGSPDFIEIVNAGSTTANLRGYLVRSYETRGNSRPCSPPISGAFGLVTQWAFPTTADFLLAPGAVLALVESGTAGQQPTPSQLETGNRITFHDSSDCEVWIEKPNGVVIDYVVFGSVVIAELTSRMHAPRSHWSDTPVIRPRKSGWVVARQNQPLIPDSDNAADWIVDGVASPGQLNTNTPTGIVAFGMGTGSPGTCSVLGEFNHATERPTLTWRDFITGAPVLGGQLELSVSSGVLNGPATDVLLLSGAVSSPLAVCEGGPTLLVQPPFIVVAPLGVAYDTLGAGDLPAIPIPSRPRLRGVPLYAQVFFAVPGEPGCNLRSTQALQIVIR